MNCGNHDTVCACNRFELEDQCLGYKAVETTKVTQQTSKSREDYKEKNIVQIVIHHMPLLFIDK